MSWRPTRRATSACVLRYECACRLQMAHAIIRLLVKMLQTCCWLNLKGMHSTHPTLQIKQTWGHSAYAAEQLPSFSCFRHMVTA